MHLCIISVLTIKLRIHGRNFQSHNCSVRESLIWSKLGVKDKPVDVDPFTERQVSLQDKVGAYRV